MDEFRIQGEVSIEGPALLVGRALAEGPDDVLDLVFWSHVNISERNGRWHVGTGCLGGFITWIFHNERTVCHRDGVAKVIVCCQWEWEWDWQQE